jgi:pSer/pThr/pTyr-binding forkhead associated (FHA) protein
VVTVGDRIVVTDLGSKNGTFLAERRIDSPIEITDSSVIRIGSIRLVLRISNPQEEECAHERQS